MPIFQIQVRPGDPGDQRCTLVLSGEADLAVVDEIIKLGTASLALTDTATLVVDLGDLTFIDSTALGGLIHLRNLAGAAHKEFRLTRLPQRIQKVIAIAGLATVFDIEGEC